MSIDSIQPKPASTLKDLSASPMQSLKPAAATASSEAVIADDIVEEQFLQIYLSKDLPLLLPVAQLAEIMKLSVNQVMPMFQMPPWVMGVFNWRGDMLWIADLAHFLGWPAWYEQAAPATEHTVVVIKPPVTDALPADAPLPTLGLLVHSVEDMVSYPAAAMQPLPPQAAEGALHPYLALNCPPSEGTPDLVLDPGAILRGMAQAQA